MYWAHARKVWNKQDGFILVEVRLGLLTLDSSNKRLQILLCIWHSVMRLKEMKSSAEKNSVQQSLFKIIHKGRGKKTKHIIQISLIMGWNPGVTWQVVEWWQDMGQLFSEPEQLRKKKKAIWASALHLNWKHAANIGTETQHPLIELESTSWDAVINSLCGWTPRQGWLWWRSMYHRLYWNAAKWGHRERSHPPQPPLYLPPAK